MTEDLELGIELETFKDQLRPLIQKLGARLQALEKENKEFKTRISVLETALKTTTEKQYVEIEEHTYDNNTILKAVAGSNGLEAAAKKLGIDKKDLEEHLWKTYGNLHYCAERWQYTAKRALGIDFKEPAIPAKIAQHTPRWWAQIVKVKGVHAAAKENETSFSALQTYLHKAGFKCSRGNSEDDWKRMAENFLKETL